MEISTYQRIWGTKRPNKRKNTKKQRDVYGRDELLKSFGLLEKNSFVIAQN